MHPGNLTRAEDEEDSVFEKQRLPLWIIRIVDALLFTIFALLSSRYVPGYESWDFIAGHVLPLETFKIQLYKTSVFDGNSEFKITCALR